MGAIEDKLKEIILNGYKSIREFANDIDIPYSTLDSVLKRGVNKSNIANVIKICEGLNIDCESLYYGNIVNKNSVANTINDSNPDSIDSEELLNAYEQCSSVGKEKILNYSRKVLELEKEEKAVAKPQPFSQEPIKQESELVSSTEVMGEDIEKSILEKCMGKQAL